MQNHFFGGGFNRGAFMGGRPIPMVGQALSQGPSSEVAKAQRFLDRARANYASLAQVTGEANAALVLADAEASLQRARGF